MKPKKVATEVNTYKNTLIQIEKSNMKKCTFIKPSCHFYPTLHSCSYINVSQYVYKQLNRRAFLCRISYP